MGVKRSRRASVSSSEDPTSPCSYKQATQVKIVHLDATSAVSDHPAVMKCSLPPHAPLTFASFDDYDVHYQKSHVNRCTECQKNLPDDHFLHLHIAEYHDPINAAKRERGEQTYACLLPTCDRVCSTPQKRRLHCIDKHQFPRNYDFLIVKDGIDRRSSMLRPPHRRQSSAFTSASAILGPSGRPRGDSTTSTVGESMETVKDGDTDIAYAEPLDVQDTDTKRYPTRLRGRGGFGHTRGNSRGVGQEIPTASSTSPTLSAPPLTDPIDSLTSSMSALQFIPPSVRAARGRGRGSGG